MPAVRRRQSARIPVRRGERSASVSLSPHLLDEALDERIDDEHVVCWWFMFVLGTARFAVVSATEAIRRRDIRTFAHEHHSGLLVSVAELVRTDVLGWTLRDLVSPDAYEGLQRAAASALRPFTHPDGSVTFPAPALLAVSDGG